MFPSSGHFTSQARNNRHTKNQRRLNDRDISETLNRTHGDKTRLQDIASIKAEHLKPGQTRV